MVNGYTSFDDVHKGRGGDGGNGEVHQQYNPYEKSDMKGLLDDNLASLQSMVQDASRRANKSQRTGTNGNGKAVNRLKGGNGIHYRLGSGTSSVSSNSLNSRTSHSGSNSSSNNNDFTSGNSNGNGNGHTGSKKNNPNGGNGGYADSSDNSGNASNEDNNVTTDSNGNGDGLFYLGKRKHSSDNEHSNRIERRCMLHLSEEKKRGFLNSSDDTESKESDTTTPSSSSKNKASANDPGYLNSSDDSRNTDESSGYSYTMTASQISSNNNNNSGPGSGSGSNSGSGSASGANGNGSNSSGSNSSDSNGKKKRKSQKSRKRTKHSLSVSSRSRDLTSHNIDLLVKHFGAPPVLDDPCFFHYIATKPLDNLFSAVERCCACGSSIEVQQFIRENNSVRCRGIDPQVGCGISYKYSFCCKILVSQDIGFKKHCQECRKCVDDRCVHCNLHGGCYIPNYSGAPCPCQEHASEEDCRTN
mmetsp:Transcript_15855/g.28453  ORF Transcript_15855/g.28453 Transcript_15855/m.28453 type:complete len:472 (+) Transcript_15855:107-1522(+)